MADDDRIPLLEVRDVSKSFGAVAAVAGVSFPLYRGEAHALVGENGAGKSTIVKMLGGVHQPDSGHLEINGERILLSRPADAQAAGIAVIYQEPTLFPDLSVAENIFLGRQPKRSYGRVDRRATNARTAELFTTLGVRIDPDRLARGLSIADQQIVEIAKALSLDARIIVMDEPTAALSGVEVERLFSVARSLRERGAAILFISHRLDEVTSLCQRVTIMRDGRHVSTDPLDTITVDTIVRRMVGRSLDALFPKTDVAAGNVVLEVADLQRAGVFHDISFTVRAGEIVALAGLVGSGRSEVVQSIFGVDPVDSGTVKVGGQSLRAGSPRAAMAAGVALVPEDRRQQGLVLDMSIARNATQTRSRALARFGLLSGGAERRSAKEWTARLQTKYAQLDDRVVSLSGGNQQKVVLAKWLATEPKVLIVDEPTRGIDVGTKAEVHRLMSDLAARGVAIIMVSSELPEVLGMADRVLVMREGRIVKEIDRVDATEETVMFAATGQGDRRVTAVTAPEVVAGDRAAVSKVGLILKVRELGIFIALVALVGYTAVSNSRFLEAQSIKDILLGTAIISVLATGQAVVVITRNIDLSVGSVLGLSAFATATLLHNKSSTPVVVALLFGLLLGLVCGLVNGALVRFGNAPSLVVTLGTLYVFRGISFIWAGGHEINADELPNSFLDFGTSTLLGVPYLVIVALLVLLVSDLFMRNYSPGRDLYAMGSNPEAARLAGVPVGRRTLQAFMFSGAMAGLAGVLFAARFGTIGATAGRGYELNVVAAVVVGGIAVFGGSGNVYGAALGALLLTVIGSSLAVLNINQFWQQAIVGSLILIAIGTDRFVASRVSAALRTKDVTHGG